MDELDLLKKENNALKTENADLKHDVAVAHQKIDTLLEELTNCHADICNIVTTLTSVKKDIRRYEVQINSLKTENAMYKNRFAKIENNVVGDLALKTYRVLREFKHRINIHTT